MLSMIKGLVESKPNGQAEQHHNFLSQRITRPHSSPSRAPSRPSTAKNRPAEPVTDTIDYAQNAGQPTNQDGSNRSENPWNSQTILALDGGGVRGYTTLRILEALMQRIAAIEEQEDSECKNSTWPLKTRNRINGPPTPAYLPCHYFDYIAGTSSGGILAIMLGRLRMSPTECLQAYRELVSDVFGHPRLFHLRRIPLPRNKFHHERLERAIKRVVKDYDHAKTGEARFRQPCEDMCRTIVVASRKIPDVGVEEPYLFRSYKHPKSRHNNLHDRNPGDENLQPIWQIGRATSAAPFSFDSIKFEQNGVDTEWLDGGLGCCNPSEVAYRSVKQLFNNGPDVVKLVMSIGTGKTGLSKRQKWMGPYGKFIEHGKTIIKLVVQCEYTHTNMAGTLAADRVPYCRLNIEKGLGTMDLDCWKGQNGSRTIEKMNTAADEYLQTEDARNKIDDFAKRLVMIRRARASFQDWHPDRWERFCHGISYLCEHGNCGRRCFPTRNDFKYHFQEYHKALFKDASQLEDLLDKGKEHQLFQDDVDTKT